MRIYDLISNQETYRADGTQTVLEVVQAMVMRNIGAVPVLCNGLLVGIFSERAFADYSACVKSAACQFGGGEQTESASDAEAVLLP